jgi:hemolysin III
MDRSLLARSSGVAAKPLLRGYLHAGAALAAVVGTAVLLALTAGDRLKQLSLLVYGASSVVLFGMSALYHIGTWGPRRRALLRRLDHANIFLLIAGTYTPIAFNVLSGGWRAGILTAVWGLALAGMVAVALFLRLPRAVTVGFYIATGWVALAAIPPIVARVGAAGLLVMVLGGLCYTAGALAYALKKPALWPRVFGYHELFHLGTLAANAAFFAFMLLYVVPAARR